MRNTFFRLSASFISPRTAVSVSNTMINKRCVDCKHAVKITGHKLIECKAIAEHDVASGKIKFDNIIHARSENGNCGINGRWFSPRFPYSRYARPT